MSDLMRRAKVWYWLAGVVVFVAGNLSGVVGGSFVRFTAWYIDDTNRATALKALVANSELMQHRLERLEGAQTAQGYTNDTTIATMKGLNERTAGLENDRRERDLRRIKLSDDLGAVNGRIGVLEAQTKFLGEFITTTRQAHK